MGYGFTDEAVAMILNQLIDSYLDIQVSQYGQKSRYEESEPHLRCCIFQHTLAIFTILCFH